MKKTLSYTYEVYGTIVRVEFWQGMTIKVPKRWADTWFLGPFLYNRQTTTARLIVNNNPELAVERTVRANQKDFPSWERGRFEALKKLLKVYGGTLLREFRQKAFQRLKQEEELREFEKWAEEEVFRTLVATRRG